MLASQMRTSWGPRSWKLQGGRLFTECSTAALLALGRLLGGQRDGGRLRALQLLLAALLEERAPAVALVDDDIAHVDVVVVADEPPADRAVISRIIFPLGEGGVVSIELGLWLDECPDAEVGEERGVDEAPVGDDDDGLA